MDVEGVAVSQVAVNRGSDVTVTRAHHARSNAGIECTWMWILAQVRFVLVSFWENLIIVA